MLLSKFEQNKSLSSLCTFGIGGKALYFTTAISIDQVAEIIQYCFEQKLPYIVIGKGSNCLFDDKGFDGLCILNKISFCEWGQLSVHVGSGYSFSLLGVQTAKRGWSGLEFACGIPASVGGAVFMNAGANGKETKDCLVSVDYINEEGQFAVIPKEELYFAYRTSSFHEKKGAIVGATFALQPSTESREKQLKIIAYRTETQPLKDKSAGCLFSNPPSLSAGALIDQCGLKGYRVGGAEVSSKHANFIVNRENATAEDVKAVAAHIQKTVKEKTGIDLKMEVRFVPR